MAPPDKTNSSRPSLRSDSVAEDSDDEFWERMRTVIKAEVTSAVNETLEKRLKGFQTDVCDRLKKLEDKLQSVEDMQQTISDIETSMKFHADEVEDVRTKVLPDMVGHFNKVVTALALQNVDLNMHRRKFSLILKGIDGAAGEDGDTTRAAVITMAKDKLGIADAEERDLAACHRLKPSANASIIARFVDLSKRDKWLSNAKNLLGSNVTMSVDLPPCLRPLYNELMLIRKDLPSKIKTKSNIKYLPSWPYLVLKGPRQQMTHHTFTKAAVALASVNVDGAFEFVIPDAQGQQ